MRVPGLKSAKRFTRWSRSRFIRGALILGYHRIADVRHDPYALCVSPQHFAEHLEVLHRLANRARLTQLIQGLQSNQLPRRTIVLTFDDGYADTLQTVKPLLDQYKIPATVFIPTGHLGGEFWWDELQRIVFSPEELPDCLSLQMNGSTYDWTASKETPRRLSPESSDNTRHQLLLSLYRKVLPLPTTEREKVFARLRDWTGIHADDQPLCRALSESELVQLASSDLLDIGAHSVTHPLLSELPVLAQRWEIEQSKRHLEQLLGRPVILFSYPNGSWSTATEEMVRDAGFVGACGSHNDLVRAKSNRFYLPRFWVKNQDGPSFSRWLKRWLMV